MVKVAALLVLAALALVHVNGQSCLSRRDKIGHLKILKATRCMEPHLAPVQLMVPRGYDFVRPSVVKLNQCTGLACSAHRDHCLPVPGETRNHTYIVEAGTLNGLEMSCMTVTVEEHLACECRCDESACPDNMAFNSKLCACECDRSLEMACSIRQVMDGHPVMWSEESCACVCDSGAEYKRNACNDREVWDPMLCRCSPYY